MVGLSGLQISIADGRRHTAIAPAAPRVATGVTRDQPVKPGLRTWTEAQATRRGRHCLRGAAQDTQQLLLNLLKGRGVLNAGPSPADAMTGRD